MCLAKILAVAVSACIIHTVVGWSDIAGALTYENEHHVFQGCNRENGWHHAASADLVHWEGDHLSACGLPKPLLPRRMN